MPEAMIRVRMRLFVVDECGAHAAIGKLLIPIHQPLKTSDGAFSSRVRVQQHMQQILRFLMKCGDSQMRQRFFRPTTAEARSLTIQIQSRHARVKRETGRNSKLTLHVPRWYRGSVENACCLFETG